jgi:hypothetical protein
MRNEKRELEHGGRTSRSAQWPVGYAPREVGEAGRRRNATDLRVVSQLDAGNRVGVEGPFSRRGSVCRLRRQIDLRIFDVFFEFDVDFDLFVAFDPVGHARRLPLGRRNQKPKGESQSMGRGGRC